MFMLRWNVLAKRFKICHNCFRNMKTPRSFFVLPFVHVIHYFPPKLYNITPGDFIKHKTSYFWRVCAAMTGSSEWKREGRKVGWCWTDYLLLWRHWTYCSHSLHSMGNTLGWAYQGWAGNVNWVGGAGINLA